MFKRFILFLAVLGMTSACVIYSASGSADGDIEATLTDNGSEVCWFGPGYPDSGGLYRFTCTAGNIAAIAYNIAGAQIVEYANPGGNYQFQANEFGYGDGSIGYSAEEYGC